MAITQCPNGHLYDTNIYQSCPYCGGAGANMINFDQVGGTVAPGGYGQNPGRIVPEKTQGIGHTVAPNSYLEKQEEENKTVSILNLKEEDKKKKKQSSPVAGWLACVEGPDVGDSYELFAKINTIGRSSDNDVCIAGDETISRENAKIAYDPKHNTFHLISDSSTNLIYLNDEAVHQGAQLSAYDLIEMGKTKLVFVPLCCEHFHWTPKDPS